MRFFRIFTVGLHSFFPDLSGDNAFKATTIAAVGSFSVVAAGTLLSFIALVLLSRMLGAELIGIYSWAHALILLFATPVYVGFGQLVMREMAALGALAQQNEMRQLLAWAQKLAVALSIGLALVLAIIFFAVHDWVGEQKRATLLWSLCFLPLGAFMHIHGASLRGLGHIVRGQFAHVALRPGLFTLFVMLSYSAGFMPLLGPSGAMALHVAAVFWAMFYAIIYNRRALADAPLNAEPITSARTSQLRRSFGIFAIFAALGAIQLHMDVLALGLLTDDKTVGIYRVAAQGLTLITAAMTAVHMVMSPSLARNYAHNNLVRMQKILSFGAFLMSVTIMPIALIMGFFAEPIMPIVFGPEFSPGHKPLFILSLAAVAHATLGLAGPALNMCGHEKDTLKGGVIGAAVNLTLNFGLIPYFGMQGAAIATITGLATMQGIWAYLLYRRTGLVSPLIGGFR